MDRRYRERIVFSLPVQVSTDMGVWKGTCINLSAEGALLKLQSFWGGAEELDFRLDPDLPVKGNLTKARVVRASSADPLGSFLAIRFLSSPGLPGL